MKKSVYTILILCIGIVIGMTSTAVAAPVKQYVQASFEKIVFVVNGEEKPLDADPLVYQGSTYLPVRTVLNALGYDVGYMADSKTVTADKEIDKLMEEISKIPKNEGDDMPTIIDSSTKEHKITSLQKSIDSSQEIVDNLKVAIEQLKSDPTLSEDQRSERISAYESRLNDFANRIKKYEEQLLELQK